ncbi:MAG: NAD-dependent epimerase/dehydratase family protein [candidate division Zixibacteria bacterium]|nr:NAD-dependent epimerase/dehydratase family protein [candidate division Zixibacteria bacterium]
MRICAVGGTGNISTSFVRLLLDLGHEVTCFNRGKSGSVPDGARVIVGDRSDRAVFEQTMQEERFDAAIDMICFNREDAESSIRAFRGVGHFIQCSTVCTYGVEYDWLPATEDHPLRPISPYGRNKVEADRAFLRAFYDEGFPVTLIKPSTTYGPKMGALRQIAWDFSWIDRIRKGKSVVVCGDGKALHQFLHVDDAALCFAHVVGKTHTVGQTYNMVRRGFTTWEDHHRTAMRVLGREVELVGVPLVNLLTSEAPRVEICRDIFAHNVLYSAEKLFRDVPEFQPKVSLADGLAQVIEMMDREGRIPNADETDWEDRLIAAQRAVGASRPDTF